jgi:hypothetical protein
LRYLAGFNLADLRTETLDGPQPIPSTLLHIARTVQAGLIVTPWQPEGILSHFRPKTSPSKLAETASLPVLVAR